MTPNQIYAYNFFIANLNTGVFQNEGCVGIAGIGWENYFGNNQTPFGTAAETAAGIANWNGQRAVNFANSGYGSGP